MKRLILLSMVVTGLIALESRAQTAPSSQLAEALRAGLIADTGGDMKGLMKAAVRLHQLGARPVEGEPDLVQVWADKARAAGVKVPAFHQWRGRVLGPAYRRGELQAGGRFSTRQSFIAGQTADVAVEPVGMVQLGLGVRDDEGKSVCEVNASRPPLGCRWVPSFTAISIITISNPEPRPVKFYLILN